MYRINDNELAIIWKAGNHTGLLFVSSLDVVFSYFFFQEIPPYNGFGSLEDSLQSCLSLFPQPPKKDFIRMLENDNKVLRYEATLVR